jgi:hypothetical protein
MKKKEKLLRIRPFNMANFSGGSYYMPVVAFLGMVVSFPATLLLWLGTARALKKEDGTLDYAILKRRLNRIVLPVCLALFVPLAVLLALTISDLSDIWIYGLAILWGAAVPTVGMYCTMSLSAALLNKKSKLTYGRWLPVTLGFSAALVAAGAVIEWLLAGLGDMLS